MNCGGNVDFVGKSRDLLQSLVATLHMALRCHVASQCCVMSFFFFLLQAATVCPVSLSRTFWGIVAGRPLLLPRGLLQSVHASPSHPSTPFSNTVIVHYSLGVCRVSFACPNFTSGKRSPHNTQRKLFGAHSSWSELSPRALLQIRVAKEEVPPIFKCGLFTRQGLWNILNTGEQCSCPLGVEAEV